MAQTQADIATRMIQQLRVLDPSVSADLGTPERKIIDTVAQALADAQVDLVALSGALDIDSKYGSNLDKFLAVLGFARQTSTSSSGVVYFSRTTAATTDIPIPIGTQVAASSDTLAPTTFLTTAQVTLLANTLQVAAPIRAVTGGTAGNVAANTITTFVGTPTLGVTAVTNPAPTVAGTDLESDDQFKLRFKNTVFRNVSGTEDQFLALAVATAFTTKANVVGPVSRYREYVQVPSDDNAATISGQSGGGVSTEWTTALSTIPYSQHIYDTIPAFVSNGASNIDIRFFVQDLDFTVNTSAGSRDVGDTRRQRIAGTGLSPSSAAGTYQPNVTFYNVLSASSDPTIEAIREGDIVLFEHSYLSSESRNDFVNGVANCVDVFIDGSNPTIGSVVIPTPRVASGVFSASPTARLYSENYRRIGEPEHRPVLGNYFSALPFQPVIDVPSFIQVGTTVYLEGVHYWPIEEVSDIGGTIRSRNGIEWAATVPGQATGDPAVGPYTGAIITANAVPATSVAGYTFDANIIDLQTAYEGAKQVTTDALAHRARRRYLKFDVTVMYSPGASPSDTNRSVQTALQTFFAGQYFGTTIQLSDLLQVIHGVSGIDNVRWTADSDVTRDRVTETDVSGAPLIDGVVDRTISGGGAVHEVQSYYFPNAPSTSTDTYTISLGTAITTPIAYNASLATINSALSAASIAATATGSGTVASPYLLTFSATTWQPLLVDVVTKFTGTARSLNRDFFLKDNELPALPVAATATDTLAGLTIRPRAANTWSS